MKKSAVEQKQRVFEEILGKYKHAWESRDPGLAVQLFTPEATYRESPFDKRPLRGATEIGEYWAEVPKHQKEITFSYGLIFSSTDFGIWGAEWRARYTKIGTGEKISLKGVLFCELSERKIRRFWEYWHIKGGTPSFRANVAGVEVHSHE